MTDIGDLLVRLAIDAAAAGALVYGVFLRRHRRMDLVVVYAIFNLGVFLALAVIAAGEVSIGVGFGLFAVLSIIRLRSEPFSNRELAYFFAALVIALVCAIDLGSAAYTAALSGILLAAAWAIDHPRLSRPTHRLEVTLELVFASREMLRGHLEERLDARVVDVAVLEIDYVRETTRAEVRYVDAARTDHVPEPTLDATFAAAPR